MYCIDTDCHERRFFYRSAGDHYQTVMFGAPSPFPIGAASYIPDHGLAQQQS